MSKQNNGAKMMTENKAVSNDFPVLQMVRTGRVVRLVGRITFVCLVISIVALFFVPWRQTARGAGNVMAIDPQLRPQPVLSPSDGIVQYVKPGLVEGDYVRKGEIVIRLSPKASDGVALLEQQQANLESKLEFANQSLTVFKEIAVQQEVAGKRMSEGLDQDIKATQKKVEQLKNEVEKQKAKLEDKENRLKVDMRTAQITPGVEIFTKQRDVEQAMQEVLKADYAVEEMLSTLLGKEEEVAGKKIEILNKNQAANQKVLDQQGKIRQISKELAELRTKISETARLEIPAPRSGFIQQWNSVANSDAVKAGKQLFVIVPDTDDLCVEMKVSGNDMPLLREGDRVRLQFEGWPAVQFVGWPSVAVGTFGGKVNRIFPTDDGKGFFRVLVVPDNHFERENGWPDDRYLRQGVRANGWVLLNRVPLGKEIWRQLNGFPPVIADDEPKQDKGSKLKLPKA